MTGELEGLSAAADGSWRSMALENCFLARGYREPTRQARAWNTHSICLPARHPGRDAGLVGH
ncbi:hypothetical protein [Labrys neptuniae]|uniref:Uncharacterized protein n=1 Tax=Labrys neptuniae TaxID=376174 RepID=A0ABV3PI03_9HYPH